MSGYASGAYNESESQQRANSVTGLRGSDYGGNAAKQANDQGMLMSNLSNQLFRTPQATMDFGRSMLDSGRYGLGTNADAGVEQLGKYMHSLSSADYGSRGFLSPENQSAVTGSAMTNALPQLIPQMQQFQLAQFQAPQNLLNTARTSADFWSRALGSQSDSSGSSNSWGFSASGGGGM